MGETDQNARGSLRNRPRPRATVAVRPVRIPALRLIPALALCGLFLQCSPAQAKNLLRAGVPTDHPPFSFVADSSSTTVRGFCVDLIRLLAANMDMSLRLSTQGRSDFQATLLENRIDLFCGLSGRLANNENIQLIETDVKIDKKIFVNRSCVTVTCFKDLPGHSVVVVKGGDVVVPPEAKGIRLLEVDSQLEALGLLNANKADVFLSDSSLTTLYLIQKNGFKNIMEVGLPFETATLALAMRKDNAALLTDLSFSLGKVMEGKEYDLIRRKWLGKDTFQSIWDTYLKTIMYALSACLLVLVFFMAWNGMLRRKVQAITKSLRLSEKKYRDLIESSPEMIHLIAPDGAVRLANNSALTRLGYSWEEMSKLRLTDMVADEQRGEVSLFIEGVFQQGYAKRELVFEARDATRLYVEIICTVVYMTDGEPTLICCFSRDMTERKRLEEELIQTERLAIIGQMAAGLAHEINNPLGIILANTEDILANSELCEEDMLSLRTIARNCVRAGDIIDNLLSYTRPGNLQKTTVDLERLIEESLVFLKQKLRQKAITVKTEISCEATLLGDENQIQQMLINLMLNAIQAMGQAGRLTVRVLADENGQCPTLHLEVVDNGEGIPEGNLPEIFNPFFTAGKKNGFGLGLFISKTIAEHHGGKMSVRSTLGQGTVMMVDLPRGQPESEKANAYQAVGAA